MSKVYTKQDVDKINGLISDIQLCTLETIDKFVKKSDFNDTYEKQIFDNVSEFYHYIVDDFYSKDLKNILVEIMKGAEWYEVFGISGEYAELSDGKIVYILVY